MVIIRIQDILLCIFVAMIFMHRYIPVDISSLWQYLLVGLVYFVVRSIPLYIKKYFVFFILCWGMCEIIIVLLQKWHCISSNLKLLVLLVTQAHWAVFLVYYVPE